MQHTVFLLRDPVLLPREFHEFPRQAKLHEAVILADVRPVLGEVPEETAQKAAVHKALTLRARV